MNYTNKNRILTAAEKQKISDRFKAKLEEFQTKTLDELKEIFNTTKLSSTDKWALVNATRIIQDKENKVIDVTEGGE